MANLIDNDAMIIGGTDYGFMHPHIVRNTNGWMWAGHINEDGDLEIHVSKNNGSSWTLTKTIPGAPGITGFNLTVRQGSIDYFLLGVLVTFSDHTADFYKMTGSENWYTVWVGQNFIGLPQNRGLVYYVESADQLWFFFDVENNYNIFWKVSNDFGASWQWEKSLDVGVYKSLRAIDYDAVANEVIVLIAKFTAFNETLNYLRFSTATGSYKGSAQIIYSGGSVEFINSDLAVDSVGNKWTIFTFGSSVKIYKNIVSNLEFVEDLITGSTSIGIDGDDNVYVFYTKASDEKLYLRRRDALSGEWSAETVIEVDANNKVCCEKHSLPTETDLNLVYYTA